MKPKKSEKANIGKKSFLFFQLGLVFMLALSYVMIEWKTYDKTEYQEEIVEMNLLDDEEVPITEMIQTPPPPPPPPPAPEIIEIIEDDSEEEEVEIEETEVDLEDEIVEVDEVADIGSDDEIEEVPFSSISDVPVFPGCEKEKTNEARKQCMQQKIQDYVSKKFDSSIGRDLGLSGVNRVYISFVIDQNGNIVDVRGRSQHPRLTKEGERVVGKLPDMKPGKQRGRAVRVSYNLPIVFQIQD